MDKVNTLLIITGMALLVLVTVTFILIIISLQTNRRNECNLTDIKIQLAANYVRVKEYQKDRTETTTLLLDYNNQLLNLQHDLTQLRKEFTRISNLFETSHLQINHNKY